MASPTSSATCSLNPAHPLVKAYTGREPWLDGRLRNGVNREWVA